MGRDVGWRAGAQGKPWQLSGIPGRLGGATFRPQPSLREDILLGNHLGGIGLGVAAGYSTRLRLHRLPATVEDPPAQSWVYVRSVTLASWPRQRKPTCPSRHSAIRASVQVWLFLAPVFLSVTATVSVLPLRVTATR